MPVSADPGLERSAFATRGHIVFFLHVFLLNIPIFIFFDSNFHLMILEREIGSQGELRISSDGDDRRMFLGLKFLIPGFFWGGKFGKYFFLAAYNLGCVGLRKKHKCSLHVLGCL